MSHAFANSPAPKDLIRLHIGGREPRATWTLMNQKEGPGVDVVGDIRNLSMFATHSVAEIYAPYVFQRFGFRQELPAALREAFRVLIPGGVLRFSIPNLEAIANMFLEPNLEARHAFLLQTLLYGEQTTPDDFNRCALSFELIGWILSCNGFKNIASPVAFDMFDDFSNFKFGSVPLSLNIICEKESNAVLLNNRANEFHTQGQLWDAINHYQMALVLSPDTSFIHSNYLYALNYQANPDRAMILNEHKKFGQACAARKKILHRAAQAPVHRAAQSTTNNPETNTATNAVTPPIRIGYVSSDFRQHAVAHFIEPVLAAHNKSKFELFCYYHHTANDDTTKRMKDIATHWRVIVGMSDEQIAEQFRKDGIDIVVDLAGHTANNRLPAFAQRLAPVQVTWLGYPNTTGLATMDYRITDAFADPIGMSEAYHTEKLFRMPECFSCYQPSTNCPKVGLLPAYIAGHVTFGSFNIFAKITPEVIALWSKILKRVPHSKLFLKYKNLDTPLMTQSILRAFDANEISADRLLILGDDPSHKEHMARYNTVDIALDPFPYNGTTTTLDALWMGVPVVTLAGLSHVSRVGVSQMSNLGLPQFIANTTEEYVEIAVKLAENLAGLEKLRETMRARMQASPLMDVARFTAHLERAFETMWSEYMRTTAAHSYK